MNGRFILSIVCLFICLFASVPDALSDQQPSRPPLIFAINYAFPNTNYAWELTVISPTGSTKIAELSGNVLYGMDDDVIAFMQTPASRTNWGSRLLVVNRKTCAIMADRYIKDFGKGFRPTMMISSTVERLAIRSKDSSVYIPVFNGHEFEVAEVNWLTGKDRQLPVPFTHGAESWEITALYPVPRGIAIERGPFLTIFAPARNATLLSLDNAGPDLRPTGNFYAFPGFGIFQS
jgi:hypothetical protein